MSEQPVPAACEQEAPAQEAPASSDTPSKPSVGRVIAAWLVHALTISGLVWATLFLFAILNNDIPMMWLWAVIALIVDGVDGTLARKVGVRQVIPWFDGAVVDNLVDYLTWTFLPALFMAMYLPFGPKPLPAIMMIVILTSSVFCYANDGEKSNDNYFVGFPAAWNCVAITMYLLQTSAWLNIAATIILAILTLVPIHYTHPARVKRFQIPNIIGATTWIIACAYLVAVYPAQPVWVFVLFWIGGGWFLLAGFIRTATGEDK
ncbi:phosphatidylcholine synthase [Schaalia meyeri]|uniref:CDP-alcohol phosphatidyltransferase family protein n=1 Tax=Schaalia meyeri TaxID=52773 RepID=UPI00067FD6BF|nr:CDP-alcohol phosphatidyltransferase family protein [Schaalia meyeri]AKU65801.1 phosphatidylcholine synthase [Schaalia meyeri]